MPETEAFRKITEYCRYYNIPISHLAGAMSNPKVVPMLRGIAFEHTLSATIKNILSNQNWQISNPGINAQSEVHDIDVKIKRVSDNKLIRIECKLSKNNSFKINTSTKMPQFQVKCMRSRTVSDNEMATRMATRYGVPREWILNHADNYREDDFDFVITSMGNAFWKTVDGKYTFSPKPKELLSLSKLFPSYFSEKDPIEIFKEKTFRFFLIACSSQIKVSSENGIVCRRKKCITSGNSMNCGFIPNYPIVDLKEIALGKGPWKIINEINLEEYLNEYLDEMS